MQRKHRDNQCYSSLTDSCSKQGQFKRWLQLGRRRDLNSWEMYPSIVNAYFNPPANEVRQSVTLPKIAIKSLT